MLLLPLPLPLLCGAHQRQYRWCAALTQPERQSAPLLQHQQQQHLLSLLVLPVLPL
jgi:hypothetical protein